MPNRILKTTAHNYSIALADTLSSLFALELFSPSHTLYLLSPWISDFDVLDNSFGQFRALLPEDDSQVRLSTVLNLLSEQGVATHILTRADHVQTRNFLTRLHPGIQQKVLPTLHEKGLLTDHFYLRGSMNFTFSGLNLNDEHVELTTEPAEIAAARVEIQTIWIGI